MSKKRTVRGEREKYQRHVAKIDTRDEKLNSVKGKNQSENRIGHIREEEHLDKERDELIKRINDEIDTQEEKSKKLKRKRKRMKKRKERNREE